MVLKAGLQSWLQIPTMRMPGELMDLWIRFHIWNGGSHLHIGYMETYTLQKLKDAADEVVQHGILEQLEARFMHCSQLFMPIWAAGHWVLLQASQENTPWSSPIL